MGGGNASARGPSQASKDAEHSRLNITFSLDATKRRLGLHHDIATVQGTHSGVRTERGGGEEGEARTAVKRQEVTKIAEPHTAVCTQILKLHTSVLWGKGVRWGWV